jgi:arginine-tRNA-protein transferase
VNDSNDFVDPAPYSVVNDVTFFQSGEMPCPYVPGRLERRLLVKMTPPLVAAGLFDDLTTAGFRRSQDYLYRPNCSACHACTPVRLPVDRFRPNRTMRRIVRVNQDLTAAIVTAAATREQYTLFHRYQATRHRDGEMEAMSFRDYRVLIENSSARTVLIEFRDQAARLVAGCLVDIGERGLSAVYSFFDTDQPARSLGTYIVVKLAEWTHASGRPHLYLGYWIEECRKMAYKIRFRPIEGLGPDGWRELATGY